MEKKHLSILNDIAELRELQHTIEELAPAWGLPQKVSMNLNLVLEEIISNIIFYAYEDDLKHRISIDFILEQNAVKVVIIDDGKAFNLLESAEFEDVAKGAEDRKIGGLGIHFVRSLMDVVDYSRENENNILTLVKNFKTNINK